MRLKKFIEFEVKKVSGLGYIAVVLIFLVASGYFLQFGIGQYKHIVEEKSNFLKFEKEKFAQFIYPAYYGNYGLRLLYEPSPFMSFFDSGPVPGSMTTFIDGSERMRIYQPLIGQSAFTLITNAFMTFSGFVLLFGSWLVLLYGFLGSKGHEWLKFLEELTGSRIKLFLYQLISRAFILLLLCMAQSVISTVLFIINGLTVNIGWILILNLGIFLMLLCFLFWGLIAGTIERRFWGWAIMTTGWFLMAFFIPVLIYHVTYSQATSIKSPYKVEIIKQKLFAGYEKGSLEEGGKFDKSKYGDEKEAKVFLAFWNGDFKKLMEQDKEILDEMKERISFYQSISAFFPTTFFLSTSNEISSRGFSNLVEFFEYSQEKKKQFIWYIAEMYLLSNKVDDKEFAPFIKGNENIYQGQARLPGNYSFGLSITVIWLIALFGLYWFRFNRVLNRAIETSRELNPGELKKNSTNVIFSSDKGLLPQLITKLRLQNIPFVSVPGPASLLGDTKVKNLFSFFGLDVPETLKEIGGKFIYSLEPDQKGKVLAEIARSLKAEVLIFDNFLAGLSDDIIHHFAGVLNSVKKDRIVVYFTNSLLVTSLICDCGIKWTDEKMAF